MNDNAFNYVLKCIMLGDQSVGKTALVQQFLLHQASEEFQLTGGIDFGSKTIETSDKTLVKLQVWDAAGKGGPRSLTPVYLRSTAVAFVVFDVTARASFKAVSGWVAQCRANGNPEVVWVLLGNKADLAGERVVARDEGAALAKASGMLYFETSAKGNEGVGEAFTRSAEAVLEKIARGVVDPKLESFGVRLGAEVSNGRLKQKQEGQPKKLDRCG